MTTSPQKTRRKAGWFPALLALAVLSSLGGAVWLVLAFGSRSSADRDAPATAEDILGRMVAAYQQAERYSDRAVIRLRYRVGQQWLHDEARISVKFVRPNRLMVRAYQLAWASDGQQCQARVEDPASGDLDGQMVVDRAPERLDLNSIYQDPVILRLIAGGLGGPPVTLELLLADSPLQPLLASDGKRERLSDQVCEGHPCFRVQALVDGEPLVFWIDQRSFLVHRLEYPAGRLREILSGPTPCHDVSLTAEFREATWDAPRDAAGFRLAPPADRQARTVRRFVLPPQPLPTPLLGQTPADFHFTGLDGQRLSRDALLGKTAILAWFTIHPASESSLRQLAEIQRTMADKTRLAILGICTEPTTVSNAEIQRIADSWGLPFRVLRDLDACGRDVFQVSGAPSIAVLNPAGTVQLFLVGANPELSRDLPADLRRIAGGENLAAELLAQWEQQRAQYQRMLNEADQPISQGAAAPPPARR